ncbi:Drug/Metabolite Transporter (DMT) Superfamily, partial [Thraustotheca clavata]
MSDAIFRGANELEQRINLFYVEMITKEEVLPLVKAVEAHHLLGLSLVACSALTFSLMSCAIKYESYVMSSMETVFWRSLFAWILILITIAWNRISLYVEPQYRFFLGIRCIVGFTSMSLGFWTMSQMVLADANVLIFTTPVFSFFLAALILHERIDGISFCCAICSFLGVICVSRPTIIFGESQSESDAHGSKYSVIGGLCAAATQALVYTIVRGLRGLNFIIVIQYFMMTSTIGSGLWMLFVEQLVLPLYLDIVFVFMWDILLLRETINLWSVVGAIIICSCAIVIQEEILPLVKPIEPPKHHHLLGISLVACSAFTFSLMSCAIKYESYVMSSMETVFWRSLFAWILILVQFHLIIWINVDVPQYRFFLGIRCIVGFTSMSLGFWTMSQMVLADASCIIFTSPVWSFFLGALILHEKIDAISFCCAICSFIGVICVSRPTFIFGESQSQAEVHGSRYAVIGGLCAAATQALVYTVVRGLKSLNFLIVIQYFMMTSTIGSGLWMLFVEKHINVNLSFDFWSAAVATGCLGYLGQLFMTKGFQLENVGIASVMRYLDIVFVFIWDITLLREEINIWSVVELSMAKYEEVLPLVKPVEVQQHHHLLGLSLVACSAFTFSLLSCAIKYESYVMSSMETVFWRSLFAWVLILITLAFNGVSLYVEPKFRVFLATRCFVGFISMSLNFWTMSQMVLADASVIIFTSPVWSFFLGALILHEKIDVISFCCAIFSLMGVICVSRPTIIFGESQSESDFHGSKYAVIGGLGAAATQALAYTSVRGLKSLNFMIVIQYFMMTCTMGSGLWLLLVEQHINIDLSLEVWSAAIASGCLGFVGQLFMTKGFQLENVGIASVMRYLDIVFVFIWDITLLREKINVWSVVGAIIICSCAIHEEVLPLVKSIEAPQYHHLLGLSLVACSAFTFSLLSCAVKYESYVMSSMETITMAYHRVTLYVEPEFRLFLSIRCIIGFTAMSLTFWTMSQMVLADASVIIFTSPVWSFFLGALVLHERIDGISFCCAICSFLGVICVSRPTIIFGETEIWCSAVATGFLGYFGQLFMTKGFQLESVGVASVMRYLDIVFVFIWDITLLREEINIWSVVGAIIICTCAIVIALRKAHT